MEQGVAYMLEKIVEAIKNSAEYLPCNTIVYRLDGHLKRVYYTDGVPGLCGYTAQEFKEIEQNNAFDRIFPSDRSIVEQNVRQCAEKGENRNFIYRIRHRTKDYIWVHVTSKMIGKIDGCPVIVANLVNVNSEMMTTDKLLRASDRGVALIDRNNREVLFVNPAFVNIAEITEQECLGKPCNESICHMGEWNREACICLQMEQSGEPQIVPGNHNRFYSMSCKPVQLGEHDALAYFLQDVTAIHVAVQSLEQKNEELNRVMDAIAGGVSVYKITDRIELVSFIHGLATMLGYTEQELNSIRNQDILNYVHKSDRALIWQKVREVLSTGQPATIAYRLYRKDHIYSWYRATLYPAGEQDGYPLIYDVITDITEANAHYLEAIDHADEMVIIADWNSRELLYLNRAAVAIGGRSVQELVGRKCSQIALHQDACCPYCFQQELTYDKLLVREMALGNRYYQTKGKRIEWNGREAFIEYVSDVTAQHNMTEKVRFDRDLLVYATRTLFPLCIISNLTQNSYNIIEYDNFATQKAVESGVFDKLIEAGLSTVHRNNQIAFLRTFSRESLLKSYAKGKKTVSLVHRQLGDDGIWHWNRTTVVFAQKLYNGDLYSITLTDCVDKQKSAEANLQFAMEEAQKANQAKTAFLSRMSHELRTPLNAIAGYAHLLEEKYRGDAETYKEERQQVAAIQQAERYLLSIINQILDTQSIEAEKISINNEIYNVSEYLRSVLEMIRLEAEENNIIFKFERRTRMHEYYRGDGTRVQQILLNILNNAIKFTPAGGTVSMTAEAVEIRGTRTKLRFVVADTGIGMSRSFVENQLFHAFNQEHNGLDSPYGGVGIGMALSKELAHKMGGDITCESEPGKGSTFTLTITVDGLPEKEAGVYLDKPLDETYDFTGTRVLVCEDNLVNQKILRKLLENKGCVVEIAENGRIGVDKFCTSAPGDYRIILMDIRMPVMNGYDATKAIRAYPRADAQGIPIFAVSANAYEQDIQQSLDSGMNAHLIKPIEPKKLYAAMEQYMSAAQQDNNHGCTRR